MAANTEWEKVQTTKILVTTDVFLTFIRLGTIK